MRLVIAPVTGIGARLELNHPPLGDQAGSIAQNARFGTTAGQSPRCRRYVQMNHSLWNRMFPTVREEVVLFIDTCVYRHSP